MVGRLRSLLIGLEVRPAGRACDCKHNPRHRIARGELRLVVKNPGPAAGENGYCSACGQLMLDAAYRALDRYRGALAGASDE